eukprot:g11926.t1
MLGWLLAFAVLSPFLCGLIVLSYALWGYVRPPIPFGIFLCYDKGSAGSLCRLLKLLISAHSDAGIFLDVDQLDDLDSIFDVIRVKTKSVVVVLTPDFLKQLWCAGEVVTALKNRVRIVPVKCDDYVPPTDEMLQKLGDHWTPEQKQILAFHGIGLRDVQRAQGWLHQLPSLHLSRYGSQEQLEAVVLEMLQLSQVSTKLFGPSSEVRPFEQARRQSLQGAASRIGIRPQSFRLAGQRPAERNPQRSPCPPVTLLLEAIWRGNLRIVARGTELSIRLLDSSSGNLFAQCVIPDGLYEHYVERVVDSSRYWVLKIVNGPRHAFIGFGFSERNDAFDFNACLADFKATFIDKVHEAKAAEAMPTSL